MIRDDAGLAHVRDQLRRAESILESYRREFLPHNEVQYRLFSGSTVDLIRSMRADIDAYLGIGTDAALAFSLEGDDVSLGLTSAGVITRTIDTFRRGLQSVAGILHADSTPGAVPKRANWIERLCDLSLAGVGPGSVQVYLDLPAGDHGLRFPDDEWQLLKDALTTLFDGLEWAAREEGAVPQSLERLSPATRLSVLGVIARLLPPQTGPVERIGYRRRGEGQARPRRATLTRRSRERVQAEMSRLAADRKFTEAEGVIRQIDLDAQSFVLRERPEGQADLSCDYPDALADTAKELLDRRVKVSGLLETSRVTHKSKLETEAIEPLGDEEEVAERVEDAVGTT